MAVASLFITLKRRLSLQERLNCHCRSLCRRERAQSLSSQLHAFGVRRHRSWQVFAETIRTAKPSSFGMWRIRLKRDAGAVTLPRTLSSHSHQVANSSLWEAVTVPFGPLILKTNAKPYASMKLILWALD